MKSSSIAVAATAVLSFAWCGQAWADEASEAALKQQVEELRKQVNDLSKRVSDGASHSNDELEQRIAELEKYTKKDQDGLVPYWKNGLRMDSADGAFKLQIFGRIQDDYTWWMREDEVTDALGETNPASEFRRARIGLGGTIYKNVVYKAEYDFAQGTPAWADVFMELKDPFGGAGINVRVGHFDEPMGLDRLTSSKYSTFTERGLQEALVPARNTGLMLTGQALENKLAWFAGFFRDANAFGDDVNNDNLGEHNLTARITGRPYISEDGTQFVHLGASISDRNPSNETVQYRSRPEVHTGPFFVDTGALADVDTAMLIGLEAAGVMGPFSVAGEFFQSDLSGKNGAEDRTFQAASIYCSYFLTGENREYDVPNARFDRVKVKKNFGADGMGAWEVALRFSQLDLNDADVNGGKLEDITFGVNWYLNPNTRIMFDIIHAEKSDPDLDAITAFTVRFAIDF